MEMQKKSRKALRARGMYLLAFLMIHLSLVPAVSFADSELDTALQNTYRACVGIDDKLSDYKLLAGINTGVQAVGTGAGIAATAVGIMKAKKDKEIEEYEKLIAEIKENSKKHPVSTGKEKQDFLKAFLAKYGTDTKKAQADIDKK